MNNISENSKSREENPYITARREWNERYGGFIQQAHTWKMITFLSLLITLVAIGGTIYFGSLPKLQPYKVEVDQFGQGAAVGAMSKFEINDKEIKFFLSDFITSLRTVYPDNNIQKDYIFNTYKYLSDTFPAKGLIDEFYHNNPPFNIKYAQKVNVTNVISLTKNQWQLDWNEERFNDQGMSQGVQKFRAVVEIVIETPRTEEQIFKNPVGVFIKEITISKILN